MAENEEKATKAGERNVIEMSIWFAILLIVVIIAAAWIFKLNDKIQIQQATIDTLTKQVNNLDSKKNMTVELIDSQIDQLNALRVELTGAKKAAEENKLPESTVVSGEVSGDVVTE